MDRKISTLSYRAGRNNNCTISLKGDLATFSKIKCFCHSTSSKDGVTDTRLALLVKQMETVQST